MSLQLILGGSGAGKTTFLYDKIIKASLQHPDRQYLILVPEQFTMQAQKDVVTRHPDHGTMNIDIVSFQRLAYRIFEELAVEQQPVLDDMGKSMVLRKVTAACRRQLGLYAGHLNKNGFISQLKSMLSEFYQYGITPPVLQTMAGQAKTPVLQQKLADFSVIFQRFQDYIKGQSITTEEVLDVLCKVLPDSKIIAGSVIALDGYTGFTPVQYRLLELFLIHARQVAVTVTADQRIPLQPPPGMQSLFYMSSQIVRRLSELAKKHQVRQLPEIWCEGYLEGRFGASKELAYLERHLFRYGAGHYTGKMDGSLELFQSSNPAAEISQVVHRIQQLVVEEGLRYRDAAVVTGDLPGYGREISHQFEQHGIPFFLDDKKTIISNPMVELIRAALEVVQRDFTYESVFRYLRTGLVTADRVRTDRMENYVLALGIRGYKKWNSTWERVYRGGGGLNLPELNEFRELVMSPLFDLKKALQKPPAEDETAVTVAGMAEAVILFLETCRVQEKMQEYEEQFISRGEYRLAKEYSQVYGMVMELLERLKQLLGSEAVSKKEFMDILDAGFSEMTVGVIPATVDRVVVGDITRSRLAHVKVLFFVGVNDGIVPARKDRGSLLSDREREFFGEHQLELAPTAREDSFQQRFYLYLAMTKPARKLIVSYAKTGPDGKSRRASYLIGELRQMFPDLQVADEKSEALAGAGMYSVEEARQQLIRGLQQAPLPADSRFLELCRWFLASAQYRGDAEKLVNAAGFIYERQGIGHAAAQALYGRIISGSVTRLEQYAACAYGHFLQYGLELMERQQYTLAAADIGNLFHAAIDLCFRQVEAAGKDWHTVTDEERNALVERCVRQVTEEYGNTILNSSSRNAYLAKRVEHITKRTVWALQQQMLKGDFVPSGFEVSFSAADNLRAMKISLSEDEALHLRGRIDRMDLCQDGQQVYVKIIDYKSGSTSFDLAAVYYGLQLQLVVYMDAVLEMTRRQFPEKEVAPAGILYYNIQNPVVQKEGELSPEELDAEILRKLKMNGLINSELEVIRHMDHEIEKESDVIPVVLKGGEVQESRSSVANRERFEKLSAYVREKLRRTGRELLAGETAAAPYKSGGKTACDYCPYHAVCGFDKKTAGYEYRRFKSKKAEEIWEEICR